MVVLSLLLFPPWRPAMPSAGLDPAWAMVIAHALLEGWQFGRDVVFTYGPLGFLAPPSFYPGLFPISMAYWLIFYGVLAVALCFLYRRSGGALWIVPLTTLLLAGLSPIQDGRVFAACFILFLVGRTRSRASTSLTAALVVLLAIAALMKMTYAAVSLPVVVLTDISRYLRFRSLPLFTPLYVVSYLVGYLVAGQELSGLWTYLATAMEISRGYNDAMVAYAPLGEIVAFGVIALLAALIMFWTETGGLHVRRAPYAALPVLAFAAVGFFAAKAGFVRHDMGHAIIPWATLPLALTAYLGATDAAAPSRTRAAVLTILVTVSLGYFASAHLTRVKTPDRTAPAPLLLTRDVVNVVGNDVAAVRQFVFRDHYGQLIREWPEFLKSIRESHPLPPFEGPTDISGGDQAILLAHGADYRPRPTFQSYSVYTPALIARNAAFLREARAPQTILLKVSSIDDRYPALDEGALWPEMLRLYDIVDFQHGYAVLKRRMNAREVRLAPIHEADAGFGETISVSSWNDGILWTELDIVPSLLGRLRSLFFKPAILDIAVTLDDGRSLTHRLVPGMASSGFVLSPFIDQTDQFVTLTDLHPPRVTAFSVGPANLGGSYFQQSIRVRFKRLQVEGEPERPPAYDQAALARLHWLRTLLASGRRVDGQAPPTQLPDGAIFAHAPTRLSLDVPAHATELSFSYGLLPGAWSNGGATTGVCFRVSGEAKGASRVLHERCLDPARADADRHKMRVSLPLENRPEQLVFETVPGESPNWDWAYWADVDFKAGLPRAEN